MATPAVATSHSDAFIASQQSASAAAAGGDGVQEESKEQPWQQNLNEIMQCPDCREFPPNLIEEFSSGDMVCASCGLVLGDRIIDTRSEWRTFANDDQNNDDPSRVGDSANPLLHGSQLETNIAFEGRDARELQRLQTKATKKNEKDAKQSNTALLAAYREISNLCDAMNISKTIQDAAKHIFKMTDDAKYFKGKSTEVIIAGCIFIACRQAGAARTFREIFSLTKVPKKEIGRTFKLLEKFLQDQKNKHLVRPISQTGAPPSLSATNATELCARYCSGLRFSNNHQMARFSSELCEKSSAVKDLAGRSPLSVAAACIYMISHLMGESKTSKQIAAVAGVSDGTIKTAYRFLYQARESLISQDWLAKGGRLDRLPVN
ncbi:cyclin-like protein [Xylaria sp. CBS 124048]|nr:cyclin-like protein [Xylaria sp. CBS 124048]